MDVIAIKRWIMCPRCGTKLQFVDKGKDLIVHECKICNDMYLTFSGELLKELTKYAESQNVSLKEFVNELILDGINVLTEKG